MTGQSKTLGDMNGWTPVLFRIQLIMTPLIAGAGITLGTWLVQSVNDLSRTQAVIANKLDQLATQHYTVDSARADHLQLKQEVLDEVSKRYPPTYLLKQVEAIDERLERLESNQQGL